MDHVLLSDVGHVRATTPEGDEFTLIPSLANMASIGTPSEIITYFSDLYDERGDRAAVSARIIVYACCLGGEQKRLQASGFTLMGKGDAFDTQDVFVPGKIPPNELLYLARHLMTHGLTGKVKPGGRGGRGQFAETFSVADHVAAAVVHLGITKEAALQLTMTEMQLMIESKYPDAKAKDVPSREEYRKQIAAIMARRAKK